MWKLMAVCRMMSLWAVESQSRFLKFLMVFELFFFFVLRKKKGGGKRKGQVSQARRFLKVK